MKNSMWVVLPVLMALSMGVSRLLPRAATRAEGDARIAHGTLADSAASVAPAPSPECASPSRTTPWQGTARVTTLTVRPGLKAEGWLEAADVVRVCAQNAGTARDTVFVEGQLVRAGEVLCRIDPPDALLNETRQRAVYDQALADLERTRLQGLFNIERARAQLHHAKQEERRRRQVLTKGAVCVEVVEKFAHDRELARIGLENQFRIARAELKQKAAVAEEKRAAWLMAREALSRAALRSPVSGRVEQRDVCDGMYVSAGVPVAVLSDRSWMKLGFKVDAADAPLWRRAANVRVLLSDGSERSARIIRVGEPAEADDQTQTVWARLDGSSDGLEPGMKAQVFEHPAETVVAIPSAAVLQDSCGAAVLVCRDDEGVRTAVTPGREVEKGWVELLEGPPPGTGLWIPSSRNEAAQNGGVQLPK